MTSSVLIRRITTSSTLGQQRRTFFTLPFSAPSSSPSSHNLKGTLTTSGPHTIYTEHRVLPYPAKQLYKVIADVDSYAQFLPFATRSEVLTAECLGKTSKTSEKGWLKDGQEGEKWDLEAELRVGAMGFEEGYVSKVETVKWKEVTAQAKDSTIFSHLLTKWSLSPVPTSPSETTNVSLHLSYSFSSPLHAAVVSAAWEKVAGLMIDGFEKRVRDVAEREEKK
ncbi:hypothetical protein T439DRAFT_326846 [Meredithblackwellia eburnea MCA 4105]